MNLDKPATPLFMAVSTTVGLVVLILLIPWLMVLLLWLGEHVFAPYVEWVGHF